jgi:molybdate transport system substrate-binding protein
MGTIRILSGGAAQGLVQQLKDRLLAQHGLTVEGSFGAVGAMRDKLLAGEPCDLLVLTQALIAELQAQGHVQAGSAVPLGRVRTGIAVKTGEAVPAVQDAAALKALLASAQGVYFPDPEKATAGIHFMKVLRELGLAEALADKLRTYPNGATAMQAMAQASGAGLVGCTQVTEILYTPGVVLAGGLPKEFELATVYTAAVCGRAQNPQGAQALIAMMAGEDARTLREAGGFDPV